MQTALFFPLYVILILLCVTLIFGHLAQADALARERAYVDRLVSRSRNFSVNHARHLRQRRRRSGYCWSRLFLGLPYRVHLAIGPRISKSMLLTLIKRCPSYTNKYLLAHSYVIGDHLYTDITKPSPGLFLDSSMSIGDTQKIIDTALSVNASSLGTPEAATQFREALKNAIKVNTMLTEHQRLDLVDELSFPVVFKQTDPVVTDHAVIYAMREITRELFDRLFKVRQTKVDTLCVGSSDREYRMYSGPRVHHYFHMGESKDYDRTIKPFLKRFADLAEKKASKKNRKVFVDPATGVGGSVVPFTSAQQLFDDFLRLGKLPKTLHTKVEGRYEQLVFEDSFYNFSEGDFGEIFSQTGANIGYGYGLLPLELAFPDCAPSRHYTISRSGDSTGIYFTGGYCNGYTHKTSSWSTLLNKPVMNFSNFSLVTEIVARVGPFAIFKIMKTTRAEDIIRPVSLPKKKFFVRFLDILASTDVTEKLVRENYLYRSVLASEFFELYNYCVSIDRKSLTKENAVTWVRRRAGGISLMTKELVARWHLDESLIETFAYTVYRRALASVRRADLIETANDFDGAVSSFKPLSLIKKALSIGDTMVTALFDVDRLADDLILFPNNEILQMFTVATISRKVDPDYFEASLKETYDEEVPDCPICARLSGKLGSQVVHCDHKKHQVTMTMTEDELEHTRTDLINTDHDPAKLAAIKDRARASMPVGGFSHTLRVHRIVGGPGCGKSYIIRKLATIRDLVYAPFTKLMVDYKGLEDESGEKYDLLFQTIHRGLECKGRSTVYVDEYASLPYEYIKMVCFLNGVEDLFLVGDTKQSKVREPEEGLYIGNHLDLDSLPTHTLLRNFRNPKDAVALLNKRFDYNMQACNPTEKSIHITKGFSELSDELRVLPFVETAFSYLSCDKHSLDRRATVRSFQGSTVDNLLLHVDESSGSAGLDSGLQVVALSRHRKTLVIDHDGSPYAMAWLSGLGLIDENGDETALSVETPDHVGTDQPITSISFGDADIDEIISIRDEIIAPRTVTVLLSAPIIAAIRYVVEIGPTIVLVTLLAFLSCFRDRLFSPLDYTLSQVWLLPLPVQVLYYGFTVASRAVWLFLSIVSIASPLTFVVLGVFTVTYVRNHWDGKRTLVPRVIVASTAVARYFSEFVLGEAVDHGFSRRFLDYASQLIPFTHRNLVPLAEPHEPVPVAPYVQTGYDEFRLMDTLVHPAATSSTDVAPTMNVVESSQVPDSFRTGTLDTDFVNPTNGRGHPKPLTETYRQFGSGTGVVFSAKAPMQYLQVMAARYFNKKSPAPTPFGDSAQQCAKSLVDRFFKECIRPDVVRDPDELDRIVTEFYSACARKSYESQFVGFDNPDVHTVRFHLKTIYKPKLTAVPDVFKPGQGISAWSKDAQVFFGASTRIVNKMLLDSLMPHVVYDNRITSETLQAKLASEMKKLPIALNGISDFTMYDAQQDQFTQEIERQFLKNLGVSEEFIELYYSFRHDYKIIGGGLAGRCGREKTSGEPGTLLFNSIVAAVITNAVFRGEGPFCMAMKGDDGFKRQAKLAVDGAAIAAISKFTNLNVKASVGLSAEFCGYAIFGTQFVDSIPRKLNKIAAHRFRSYEHFCEFQTGLRDWVAKHENDGVLSFLVANCQLYQVTYSEMNSMLNVIKSISKIDRYQFETQFPERTDVAVVATTSGVNIL